jgi:hypothetical protein
MRAALAILTALTLSTGANAAQSVPGAPVDVTVAPRAALVGQPVTIRGTTGFHKQAASVTVSVKPPSGPAKAGIAAVSEKGEFVYTFKDTTTSGKYLVDVTGPKGKGRGKGEFVVTNLSGLADQLDAAYRDVDKRADQLLAQAKKNVQALPASAERDEMLKKLAAAEANWRTVDLPPVTILGVLRKASSQVVNVPNVQIVGKLQESLEDLQDATEEIDRSGVIGRRSDSICETINTAIEGAKFAGVAMNVAKTALGTLRAVLVDKSIGSLVPAAAGSEGPATLAMTSLIKSSVATLDGKAATLQSGLGIVLDAVEFGIKHVYTLYCERIQGPARVRMLMTWNENGNAWLRYGVRLEGRLSVRYEKNAKADTSLPVTGEFEGSATRFTFWEDVFVVEPLPRGILPTARVWLAPPGVPAAVDWPVDFGSILRSVTPYSFNIPIVGSLSNGELRLRVEPARVDFTSLVENRLLLVVFNGITPDFRTFSFPIEKAQWIVLKGLGDDPKLKVEKANGQSYIAEKRRHHRETAGKGVVVDWDIGIDTRLKKVADLPAPPFSQ